ncbi:MAG: hypothetical protein RL011_2451 [Pseudomonadota bacterium]|jgi:uncharacterized protein YkwD
MPVSKRSITWPRWLIASVLASKALPAQAHDPRLRSDLADSLGHVICEGQRNAGPLKLWERGIFDSQIDSQLLAEKNGTTPQPPNLAKRARALAALRNAGGYSYGLCNDKTRGWIAALRAPVPVNLVPKELKLKLPQSELNSECSSYQIDFASADDAKVRQLSSNTGDINLSSLGRGVVSISCQPKTPKWRGPVLWYLVPVALTDGPQVPFAALISSTIQSEDPSTRLLTWVNRIREKQNLAQLQPQAALKEAASRLSVDRSVDHNRTSLGGSSTLLQKQGIKLLAEDRVIAEDLATMTWLLWFSPRHRASLLRSDARLIGIDISADHVQSLGVVLLGNLLNQST